VDLSVPVLFVYSENDEIIASSHCERLMKNIDSKYQKIVITPCTHNQTRPSSAINEVFRVLGRFAKTKCSLL
jgi:pimeloyl-ACP methyl ester carboxylesterase